MIPLHEGLCQLVSSLFISHKVLISLHPSSHSACKRTTVAIVMVKIKTSCLLCGISEASKATRNNPIASLILKSLNTSIRDILNFTNCLDNSPSHPEIEERRGKLSSPPINPEICGKIFLALTGERLILCPLGLIRDTCTTLRHKLPS